MPLSLPRRLDGRELVAYSRLAEFDFKLTNVPASGHRAFFLDEVPQTANRRGVVEIQNPNGGITGVGLRFSPAGSFTSIPIIQ